MLDELNIPKSKNKELQASAIEYNCMMLEKALTKKASSIHILKKSIHELENYNPPLFPNWKDTLNQESYTKVIERLKASCILYELRLQVTKQFFIGIVGPQNAGKTTLTNLLLGKTVEICGDDKHTENANLYKLSDEVIIVDFAGQTSTNSDIANIANQCGAMVSCFIFLTDFRGDPENTDSSLIEQIIQFNSPILVCLNQVSRRSDSLPNFKKAQQYKDTWKSYINDYLKENYFVFSSDYPSDSIESSQDLQCNFPEVSIELTEFRDFNKDLETKGVRDIKLIHEWVSNKMNDAGYNNIPNFSNLQLKSTL